MPMWTIKAFISKLQPIKHLFAPCMDCILLLVSTTEIASFVLPSVVAGWSALNLATRL